MDSLRKVLEELARITGAPSSKEVIGRKLPGMGVIVDVTVDEIEGVLVWYREKGGSTRIFLWEPRGRQQR